MNILKLLNRAKDEVAYYNLNDFITNIHVSVASDNLSKKPEIRLVLRTFDTEQELVTLGNNALKSFRVERFETENNVPYVFYRANKDEEEYHIQVCLMARANPKPPTVFRPPMATTFSALSRAK